MRGEVREARRFPGEGIAIGNLFAYIQWRGDLTLSASPFGEVDSLIYSFSFLFAGIAIYGSSFFTALNNGLISALISFLFQVAAVLIVPLLWGLDGIRLSIVAADLMR